MRSRHIIGAMAVTTIIGGCDSAVAPRDDHTAPALAVSAQGPVEAPFLFIAAGEVNPCTGETISIRYEGTRRTQVVDDHRVVHIAGTVTTSDGYVGTFNRQLVFHGTDVVTRRFFETEVGSEHQRVQFTSNLHLTIVDGEVKAVVENTQLRCIGKPI